MWYTNCNDIKNCLVSSTTHIKVKKQEFRLNLAQYTKNYSKDDLK